MKENTIKQLLIASGLIATLLFLSPLEYDNFKASTVSQPVIWTIVAISLIKVLSTKGSMLNIIIVGLGSLIYLILMISHVLGLMACAWTHNSPLYVSKSDKSVRICCRTYECATTETSECKLYKEWVITEHIKWVTKVKIKSIDTSAWRPAALGNK